MNGMKFIGLQSRVVKLKYSLDEISFHSKNKKNIPGDGQFSFSISINLSGGRTLKVKETVKVLHKQSSFSLCPFLLHVECVSFRFVF